MSLTCSASAFQLRKGDVEFARCRPLKERFFLGDLASYKTMPACKQLVEETFNVAVRSGLVHHEDQGPAEISASPDQRGPVPNKFGY